jgi:hypothetical protein
VDSPGRSDGVRHSRRGSGASLIGQRSVVQVHLGPPLDHLVRGTFAVTPSAAFQSCLSICLATVPAE